MHKKFNLLFYNTGAGTLQGLSQSGRENQENRKNNSFIKIYIFSRGQFVVLSIACLKSSKCSQKIWLYFVSVFIFVCQHFYHHKVYFKKGICVDFNFSSSLKIFSNRLNQVKVILLEKFKSQNIFSNSLNGVFKLTGCCFDCCENI